MTVTGWQLLRQSRAAAAPDTNANIARAKPIVARYFLDHIVPEAAGLAASARAGADVLYALDAAALAS